MKPDSFVLSNNDCRHRKLIDLLDENGFKPITVQKDDPGFMNLNFLTYFRFKLPLEEFKGRNPGGTLPSTGVTLSSDKTGKTPLDYVSCVSEAFKRIKKGSRKHRRILLKQKPRGTPTYKSKMEKRIGLTFKQGYVN